MKTIDFLNKIHRDYSYLYSRDLISREEYLDFVDFYNDVAQQFKDNSS